MISHTMAVTICIVLLLGFVTVRSSDHLIKETSLATQFNEWNIKYNKIYSSQEEYKEKFHTFTYNFDLVKQLNDEHGPNLEFELNQFADLNFEEFKRIYLTEPQHCSATGNYKKVLHPFDPVAVDWRNKNVVTPVKNQGKCGSCWTFSTTGCLESHHAIKTGQLISLSEQQLVDCASAFNNNGCSGFSNNSTCVHVHCPSGGYHLKHILYNGGLESEKEYPYTAENGKCRYNSSLVQSTISGVINITKGAEADIGDAIANVGPVSIAFEVLPAFQHYKKGIYQGFLCSKSADHVNHAVLIVGYNQTESGEQYWMVKNSWTEKWGLDGYFWIKRGKNACGLADCAAYPKV